MLQSTRSKIAPLEWNWLLSLFTIIAFILEQVTILLLYDNGVNNQD